MKRIKVKKEVSLYPILTGTLIEIKTNVESWIAEYGNTAEYNTHISDDGVEAYLCIERMENDEEFNKRKEQLEEKKKAIKNEEKKEKELYRKLHKKYGKSK